MSKRESCARADAGRDVSRARRKTPLIREICEKDGPSLIDVRAIAEGPRSTALDLSQAAIHRQVDAGDVARLIRREKVGGGSQLIWKAEAAERRH